MLVTKVQKFSGFSKSLYEILKNKSNYLCMVDSWWIYRKTVIRLQNGSNGITRPM